MLKITSKYLMITSRRVYISNFYRYVFMEYPEFIFNERNVKSTLYFAFFSKKLNGKVHAIQNV